MSDNESSFEFSDAVFTGFTDLSSCSPLRCFVPAAGNSVTWVRFPVGPVHRRHLQQVDRNNPHSSITTEEERGDPGPDEGSGETKRARLDRSV